MVSIAFFTSKGGVAKTCLSLETVAGLQKRGYKTLLVDMDCQGSASVACGLDIEDEHLKTLENLLNGENISDVIIHDTPFGDIIANNLNLFNADQVYSSQIGAMRRVKKALENVNSIYDFVILDCPPSFGFTTLSALVAADYILVPQLASMFSLISLKQLNVIYTLIKENENPNLKILGVFLTKYNPRTRFTKDMTSVLKDVSKDLLNAPVFESKIRNAIAVEESILANKNIFDYAPGSKVAEDFNSLIDEILKNINMPKEKK